MKKLIKRISVRYLSFLLVMITSMVEAQNFDHMWNEVKRAERDGLPKSVVLLTDSIYREAVKTRNTPQMMKAYIGRMKYRKSISTDSFYTDIRELEKWSIQAVDSMEKAVLHSMLARMYAQYASVNERMLPKQADDSFEPVSEDMRTWGAVNFADRVKRYVIRSLSQSSLLLATSTESYVPFTSLWQGSESYGHDMYHLISYYNIESLGMICNELDSRKGDIRTGIVNLIDSIYSDMVMHYSQQDNKVAVLLVKLEYLGWKYRDYSYYHMKNPEEDPYLRELDLLIDAYKALDVCAEVYLAKAEHVVKRDWPVNALAICEEAIRRYPSYVRINALYDQKEAILTPLLESSLDKLVYPNSETTVKIRHKNLDGFKIILAQNGKPVSEQYFALKRSADFQKQDTIFSFKTPSEGIYQIRFVPDSLADEIKEQTMYSTRLTIVAGNLPQNQFKIVTLDRQTGNPVPGVDVTLYDENKKIVQETKTDNRGVSIIATDSYRWVSAKKGMSELPCTGINVWNYRGGEKKEHQIILFTDRSTYLPGQTVHIKGVVCTLESDTSNVLPDKEHILTLTDANKQEIGKESVRTNDFGSFATEFVLPVSCLNGTFRILVDGESVYSFRVEEYKRPTFHLVFDQQRKAYQLGDTIQVTGQVTSFSQIPLRDLVVDYFTSYFADYPSRREEAVADKQLTSGKIRLDDKGRFSIPLILVCDTLKKKRQDNYKIEVSVKAANEEKRTFTTYLSADTTSFTLYTNDIWRRKCKDDIFPVLFRARNSSQVDLRLKGSYALYSTTKEGEIVPGEQPLRTGTFVTEEKIEMDWRALLSGNYVLIAKALDDKGRVIEMKNKFVLFSSEDSRPIMNSTQWLYVQKSDFDEHRPAVFYYGTSLKDVYIMMDICNDRCLVESRIYNLTDSIVRVEIPYREEYKNGASVRIYFLKGNEVYSNEVNLRKLRPSGNLSIKWNTFRDNLKPGQMEKWTLSLMTPEGKPADAEMLVSMYDASLYKMSKAHYYVSYLSPNYTMSFNSLDKSSIYSRCLWRRSFINPLYFLHSRDEFDNILNDWSLYDMRRRSSRQSSSVISVVGACETVLAESPIKDRMALLQGRGGTLRTDFSETAFFYPQLRTDRKGKISFSFTMPHTLTQWHLRGYAHTKGMLTGIVDTLVTTSKEFILTPNYPRFIRVGDKTSITASIANMSTKAQSGFVSLTFFDPETAKEISTNKQSFHVEAGKTVGINFLFDTPEGYSVVGWKMIADGTTFSDGEQHLLPVLSDKETVFESLPLTIRDQRVCTFSLDTLFDRHGESATGKRLTVEFTGNPVWYAIQALSRLKQPDTDDVVAWATAYYANALAAYIAHSHPEIRTVVNAYKLQGESDNWRQSHLKQNQDLKNISLVNSPWIQEAWTEEGRKASLITLFDANNIHNGSQEAVMRLKKLQNADGTWSWYHGMHGNRYMTTYIALLISRLGLLTGNLPDEDSAIFEMQRAAFSYFHLQAQKEYENISERKLLYKIPLSEWQLQYLYLIAISEAEVPAASKSAYDYFLSNVESLIAHSSIADKALAAIVLHKAGKKDIAVKFLASLREFLTSDSENGTFFAFNTNPSYWHTMKVPAHILVMEAFHTVQPDSLGLMEGMKSWLIRQNQVGQWENLISTADAVYAILMYGERSLGQCADLKIKLDNRALPLSKRAMPGTGYLKESFTKDEVVNARSITVAKKNKGIAWGAVHARYELPVGKMKKQNVNGMNLDRTLYVEQVIDGKVVLKEITEETPLLIGDKVVSQLTFSLDRPMNFVQLRDSRGGCFEPTEIRPGYKKEGQLAYYMDVKNDVSHFFFDYLDKGMYIIRHSYRVSHTGTYTVGTACIQNAYAPDFVAQTGAEKVTVIHVTMNE